MKYVKNLMLALLLVSVTVGNAFSQQASVVCEKPGRLKSELRKVDIANLKQLTISGSLNDKDMLYMQTITNLEYVDMSKATCPHYIDFTALSKLSTLKVASDCSITVGVPMLDELHIVGKHEVSVSKLVVKLYTSEGHLTTNEVYIYTGNEVLMVYDNRIHHVGVTFIPWDITVITPQTVKNDPILKYFYDVTYIGRWPFHTSNIVEIEMPKKLKKIEESAFWGCKNLKKVTFRSTLSSVGKNCFRTCDKLEEINIEAYSIGEACFYGCTSVKKARIIAHHYMGKEVLYGCGNRLDELTIKAPIINSFGCHNKISKLNILEGVTTMEGEGIGYYTDTVVLPASLAKCSYSSVSNLKGFMEHNTTLIIKNKNMDIVREKSYYSNYYDLEFYKTIVPEGCYEKFHNMGFWNVMETGQRPSYNIHIETPGTILSYLPLEDIHKVDSLTVSGILYEYDVKIIKQCNNMRYLDMHNAFIIKSPKQYEEEKVGILELILRIGALYADATHFIGTGQNLGATEYVESMFEKADYDKYSNDFYLYSINFKNHWGLETVILPVYATSIPYGSFEGCVSLKNVVFPPTIKAIGEKAFYGCKSMEKIVIPKCDVIYEESFDRCESLKTIEFANTVRKMGKICYCDNLVTLELPDGLEEFGGITDCKNIQDIFIPESVKLIYKIGGSSHNINLHFSSPKVPTIKEVGWASFTIIIPKGSITSYYNRFGSRCKYIEE